jgi:hypothetical protein
VAIELSDPAIGERVRGTRLVPSKLAAEMLDGLCATALASEAGEELIGEEMAVSVVEHMCGRALPFHT